jgi:hypothetical protein
MSVTLSSITGVALLDTTTNPGTVFVPEASAIVPGDSKIIKVVNNPGPNTLTIDGNTTTLQGPSLVVAPFTSRQLSYVVDKGTPAWIATGGSVYDTFKAETTLLTSTLFTISSGFYPLSNTPMVSMDIVISQLTDGFGTSSLSSGTVTASTFSNGYYFRSYALSTKTLLAQTATFSTIGLSTLPLAISSGYAYWNEELVVACNTIPVPATEMILSSITASTGTVLQNFNVPHTALNTRISFASANEAIHTPPLTHSFLVNTSSFSGTLVLPQASTVQGGLFLVLDESLTFPTNPLTLSTTTNDFFYPSLTNTLEIIPPATTLVALQDNRWKVISQTKSTFSTFYPNTTYSHSTTTSTCITTALIAPTHAHLQLLAF